MSEIVENLSKCLAGRTPLKKGVGDANALAAALSKVCTEGAPDEASSVLTSLERSGLLPLLVTRLSKLDFEGRKHAARVAEVVLRGRDAAASEAEFVASRLPLIETLMRHCADAELALLAGPLLRECLQHECLARALLSNAACIARVFELANDTSFDIAAEACATLRTMLTAHTSACADLLTSSYEAFFELYLTVLKSSGYLARRLLLKLLGEVLMLRSNFEAMTRFVASGENLKLIMSLMRDESRNIRFEAFHVFKIFAANPSKSVDVRRILQKNGDRLVRFLSEFRDDKREGPQFREERAFLIRQLEALREPPTAPSLLAQPPEATTHIGA